MHCRSLLVSGVAHDHRPPPALPALCCVGRQALRVRFGEAKKGHPLAGIKKHLWDALGVAVYHADGAKLGEWQG